MNVIDYRNIADSVDFYSERGYQNIEVPWYVTNEAMKVTRPPHKTGDMDYQISTNDKYLVASAEQSFIYMMMKGQLPPGFYQGITPCYRFEPIGSLHRKVFMKNELIYIAKDDDTLLTVKFDKIIKDAKNFFEVVLDDKVEMKQIITEDYQWDLMYKGEELGSYGIRKYKKLFKWAYGTGCAEPRLSIVKKM